MQSGKNRTGLICVNWNSRHGMKQTAHNYFQLSDSLDELLLTRRWEAQFEDTEDGGQGVRVRSQ